MGAGHGRANAEWSETRLEMKRRGKAKVAYWTVHAPLAHVGRAVGLFNEDERPFTAMTA